MFGKLIKHEFRATARRLVPELLLMLGISFVAGFALPVLSELSDRYYLDNGLFGKFCSILHAAVWAVTIAVFIVVGVVALVLLIDRFKTHVLGNEGYTTMTLPVSVHEILWSKMIVFFVWFVVTGICVTAAILFIVRPEIESYKFKRIFQDLEDLLRTMPRITALDLLAYGLEGLLSLFVSYSSGCLQVYASLMIGQSAGKYKIALAVIVYVALSSAFSIGGFMLIALASTIWGNNMDAIHHFNLASHYHPMILLLILISAISGVICYLITAYGMTRRLNLE